MLCRVCGQRQVRSKGLGRKDYKCTPCHKKKYGTRGELKYRKHKGSRCEFCGFLPAHPCQLDVDHKDGVHSNNSPENLQTLCANCHRLKTFLNAEYE